MQETQPNNDVSRLLAILLMGVGGVAGSCPAKLGALFASNALLDIRGASSMSPFSSAALPLRGHANGRVDLAHGPIGDWGWWEMTASRRRTRSYMSWKKPLYAVVRVASSPSRPLQPTIAILWWGGCMHDGINPGAE
ncbi:hypothetical protein B0T22DRAFT_468643 [Podospora appendiculata]|uniref:Uncharacterized protein n=1 Tax=Podospora appendiculata TaxID=314037 RepID=A0AAE0X2V2_9PEZI|nr:hypothetical protein B0T22DRAFT_468643 [Podospora appendiculata]